MRDVIAMPEVHFAAALRTADIVSNNHDAWEAVIAQDKKGEPLGEAWMDHLDKRRASAAPHKTRRAPRNAHKRVLPPCIQTYRNYTNFRKFLTTYPRFRLVKVDMSEFFEHPRKILKYFRNPDFPRPGEMEECFFATFWQTPSNQ
jgi:hypothetical protein